MPPISLTPQFQRFGVAPQAATPQQQQRRGGGINPLALALGAAGRGLIEGGSRGGLGTALLGATSAAIPAFAQGQQAIFDRQAAEDERQALLAQQELENQRARQKALFEAGKEAREAREFGITTGLERQKEQRLSDAAASAQALGQGNLGLRGDELALRQREFDRGPVDPLVEVFDATSPTGSRFAPRSEAAGAPSVGSFSGTGLTPGKAEELGAQASGLQGGLGRLDTIISDLEANPQRAGAVGAINKFLQTGLGIAREGIDLIPGAASVTTSLLGPAITEESDEVKSFLNDQSIERNQTAANSLAYIIARARKGGDRVTVKDVELAFDDLQLTGLKSTKQKIAQLREIRNELQTGIGLIQSRVAAAPGVGGQTVTQPIPPQSGGGQVIEFDAQGNIVQ